MRAGSGLWQIVLVLLFNRKDFCGPVYLKANYQLLSQCVLEFNPRDSSPCRTWCVFCRSGQLREMNCVRWKRLHFTHFAQQPWCQTLHTRPSAMKMISKSHMSQLYTSGWTLSQIFLFAFLCNSVINVCYNHLLFWLTEP